MWSIVKPRPLGRVPMRRITLFVSAMLMALFSVITIISTSVQAQTTTDINAMATWSGDNLQYATVTLEKRNRPSADNPDYPNLAGTGETCENTDNLYYSAISESPSTPDVYWLYVICIDEGWDGNDKSQQIDATMLDYSLPKSSTDIRGGAFTNVNPHEIKIAPEGTDALGQPSEDIDTSGSTSSCNSKYSYGLSWIVCPVTNWLAAGTDALFNVLKGFLIVSPLLGENGTTLYYAWGIMRNFANILFIVAFLVIIYSQITNYGISNYGIKRLMPRLVIAAVLVNMSYWLSALAVDLSNVLGMSLQSLFLEIRNNIPPSPNVTADDITFSAMAGAVLSGSAAALGAGFVAMGVVATAGASIWFLLVSLVGVMVSALVAILVLAARQALITILIIVSPLAFVAFLLPSTEKYFDRWKTIFVTLLMVFPILSVVFGGSQLAGTIIIHSALEHPDNENFFNLLILGMVVQIIPFVITPLLVRLSGSVAGRIAGIVNNPNKGIVDKTRKFAQNRHDMTKNRQLWALDKNGNFANTNPLARGGRRMALREMNNSHRLKAWESGAIAAYEQDSRAHEVYRQTALNEMRKTAGENEGKAEFAHEVARNDSLRRLFTRQQVNQENAELAGSINKTIYEVGRTSPSTEANVAIRALYGQAAQLSEDKRKETMRQASITGKQEDDFYAALDANQAMREYAGAKVIDEHGDVRAKVTAQSKLMAASTERVNNYKKGFIFDNIDKDSILEKAAGRNIDNNEEWEAAINHVLESKDSDNIIKLSERIDLTAAPTSIRQTFELAYKSSPSKPIYATAGKLGAVAQGQDLLANGHVLMNRWQLDAVKAGKYGTADLVQKASKEEIRRLTETIREAKAAHGGNLSASLTSDVINAQRARIKDVFKDPRMNVHLGDNETFLRELGKEFGLSDSDLRKP